MSPEEEVAELERLAEVANAQEGGSLAALEADLAVLALQERIMFRASPILAADLRLKRDLLARALRHHAGEAERVNDADGPEWWSAVRAVFRAAKARGADNVEVARAMREEIDRLDDRARALSGLLREREQLVRGGVAEPVGDPQEALRMAEEAVAAAEDASSTKH